jgi:hypothetical protein
VDAGDTGPRPQSHLPLWTVDHDCFLHRRWRNGQSLLQARLVGEPTTFGAFCAEAPCAKIGHSHPTSRAPSILTLWYLVYRKQNRGPKGSVSVNEERRPRQRQRVPFLHICRKQELSCAGACAWASYDGRPVAIVIFVALWQCGGSTLHSASGSGGAWRVARGGGGARAGHEGCKMGEMEHGAEGDWGSGHGTHTYTQSSPCYVCLSMRKYTSSHLKIFFICICIQTCIKKNV